MKVTLLLLCALGNGWAVKYPIDTTISIPNVGFPNDSIPVKIGRLDTSLIFFTTPGTLSCPGGFSGDIKNVKKVRTQNNPNPSQDYFLWNVVATCGVGQNSYSAQNTYYEYEYIYHGKLLYINFVKFNGPNSFPSGTFPDITFQINIDTTSHKSPAPVKRHVIKIDLTYTSDSIFDLEGRKVKSNRIKSAEKHPKRLIVDHNDGY